MGEYDKQAWLLQTFPEWGSWLNEEIETTQVPAGNLAMWWLGCTGIWLKTDRGTNLSIDFWCGSGKRTQEKKTMAAGHQMANMCGGRLIQPNLRAVPFVLDPYRVRQVDAVLATHFHADHMDAYYANAVLENVAEPVPFIGPKKSVEKWIGWGVPAERCITVRPGDTVRVKDVEIVVLDSFDRTCLVTTEGNPDIRGVCPTDMDDKAVNYLIKTNAGSVYHSGDSHYSIGYAEHGKRHRIDVAFGSFGENPVGVMDKMTSVDILRMAEALRCKVVIPFHYDVWTNFMADIDEILLLYRLRKERLDYQFHPFIWEVGGKYVWPQDAEKTRYHHRRGFEDCFDYAPNVPFKSIL